MHSEKLSIFSRSVDSFYHWVLKHNYFLVISSRITREHVIKSYFHRLLMTEMMMWMITPLRAVIL